jgi:cysteinyl-tRNA synthetase
MIFVHRKPRWPAYENVPKDQIEHPLMKVLREEHRRLEQYSESLGCYMNKYYAAVREIKELNETVVKNDIIQSIVDRIEDRRIARDNGDYETSDQIRNELETQYKIKIRDRK